MLKQRAFTRDCLHKIYRLEESASPTRILKWSTHQKSKSIDHVQWIASTSQHFLVRSDPSGEVQARPFACPINTPQRLPATSMHAKAQCLWPARATLVHARRNRLHRARSAFHMRSCHVIPCHVRIVTETTHDRTERSVGRKGPWLPGWRLPMRSPSSDLWCPRRGVPGRVPPAPSTTSRAKDPLRPSPHVTEAAIEGGQTNAADPHREGSA